MNLASRLLLFGMSLLVVSIDVQNASAVTLNSGDVVVLESSPNRVVKIDPATGQQTLITSAITEVLTEKIEYAPWGKLYAITRVSGKLLEIDPGTGNVTTISSGQFFVNPRGLDFTASGRIVVVDTGSSYDGRVVSIDPSTGIQTLLFDYNTFGPYTYDAAIAHNGDLYVTEVSGGLAKYTGAVTPVPLSGSISGAVAVTFESPHTLLAVASTFDAIKRISLPSGTVSTVTSNGYLTNPLDVAANRSTGAIYAVDYDNNYVVQIDPISGAQSLLSSGNLLSRPTGITIVQGAVVPEPATAVSALCGVAFLIAARFRARRRDGPLGLDVV